MRIPGDFGSVSPVGPDGKPRGEGPAGEAGGQELRDLIVFSLDGRRLSADITAAKAGAAGMSGGLDSGTRARVTERIRAGFYERPEVLAEIAARLLGALAE